jgi:threonine aldolase
MVFATVAEHKVGGLAEHLKQRGILIMAPIADALRLVTHLDLDADAIRTVVADCSEYFA